LLIVAALMLVHFSDHHLLNASKRIISTKQFESVQYNVMKGYTYLWQSDQALLFFHFAASDRPTVHRYDTRTNVLEYPALLDKIFAESNENSQYALDVVISPDGRWLAWPALRELVVSSTDGKTCYTFPGNALDEFHFTNDNLHLIEIVTESTPNYHDNSSAKFVIFQPRYCVTHAIINTLNTPQTSQNLPVSRSSPLRRDQFNDLGFPDLWTIVTTKTVSANNVLFGYYLRDRMSKAAVQDIYHMDLTKQGASISQSSIRFPEGLEICEMRFSNRGDRIAWLLSEHYSPPFLTLIHRFFPTYSVRTQTRLSLRISKLDGTDMHEIGYIEGDVDSMHDLTWLPSDRDVSFVYQDSLWTAPVN